MKLVFTICSNNYLSQAKTLGDSLIKHNPDYKFVIGLCDKKNPAIDYSFFEPHEIVEVRDLNIENFEWMLLNYYIIELNTSIKPFFFKHFIDKYEDIEVIMYFDPDIKIFNSLSYIENELHNKSILLTPHILSPIPLDGHIPREIDFLNYGIYNLGFIGIRPSESAFRMLDWWAERLAIQSFDRVSEGLFVDQLPMNLVPLFFDNVVVSGNTGLNFAYWNFHEREISKIDNTYFINKNTPLVFFHFSSFKPTQPLNISHHQTRFKLEPDSLLYNLFSEYANELIHNKYVELKEIKCYYSEIRDKHLRDIRIANEQLHKKQNSIFVRVKNKLRAIIKVPITQ
ncbi:MAG: hypothetical protein ACK5M3_16985 [Dysgonomonas sp.]